MSSGANSNNFEDAARPQYRADIDGLRAIAILSVVGFHAFPSWIKGGFIGVDIFFVISGFLISTIIFNGLEQNSFSFIEFYSRRIKRIFPALLLVLACSFSFGWFVLFSDEYKQLGKHIAGGAGFISNFLFWNESGYFDNSADTKPLLHLWSLGVEEQFYIFWPLLLWLSYKKRFNMLAITIAIAAISFKLNIDKAQGDAVAAFYSPQTRIWELMAGSILAHMTKHRLNKLHRLNLWLDALIGKVIYARPSEANGKISRNVRSAIGVVLIVTGILVITKEKSFPGWWAILPTLGTMLIISAGTQSWVNRVVLSHRAIVWVGLISYPLYLWHWPLLSFARIIQFGTPDRDIRIATVLTAVALAWITYKLIEKPIRLGGCKKTIALSALMVAVGYTGYNCYARDGLPFRPIVKLSQPYMQSMAVYEDWHECHDIPHAFERAGNWFCTFGKKASPPAFFAYGDSHASSLLPAIRKLASENDIKILFSGGSGCPPLLDVQADRGAAWIEKYNCQKLNDRIFRYIRDNKIKTVLLIARWTYYTAGTGTTRPHEGSALAADAVDSTADDHGRIAFEYGLKQTLEKYKDIGVKVYLFEDNPQQLYDPKDALRYAMRKSRLTGSPISDASINKLAVTLEEHKKDQYWVTSRFEKNSPQISTIVNFDGALCVNSICPLIIGGKFLYTDNSHLSVDGAMLAYPALAKALSASLPNFTGGGK